MDLLKVIWGDKDYIDLVQNMDSWWTVVNVAMNLRVSLAEDVLVPQTAPCSLELVIPQSVE
jgi:hypothetical protein